MADAPDNLAQAREAFRLSQAGLTGKDLSVRLGVRTPEAHRLVSVGWRLHTIAASALTAGEILLLRSLAACERDKLNRAESGSVTSFAVACAARKSQGWPGTVSAKRLRTGTAWCAETRTNRPVGLGLIDFSGNGYLNLTPLGWLVVQALEAVAA